MLLDSFGQKWTCLSDYHHNPYFEMISESGFMFSGIAFVIYEKYNNILSQMSFFYFSVKKA